MENIKIFTIESLSGFEGNHANKISEELESMKDENIKELYQDLTKCLQVCIKEPNYPDYIMEHINALRISIMQEQTIRENS